ncbi:GAF domain-containing sensor histidine kinase [Falsiroseomonas selenitidurans]|uniref:histidine kinase n=1 Tax=Falsiroseomonas selenitidurans TaxID=2716335 RepID=A0ABX1E553_9PROT|nr:GAF domain-containing sensor histidine kinase [Falsiroseomonas selenitidurans]NKC32329.1 GAF domain-containing sensor histidine kinase [Falsiroseomonas selenitidurans]
MRDPQLTDLGLVARIAAVPSILDILRSTTGMGFAAVARVTEDRWVACQVLDLIGFGLEPGGELPADSTICHEIRQHRAPVVIDDIAADQSWRGHPTPVRYGFRSYISHPICLPDGRFFGTLCAIDPSPRPLNTPAITGMFRLFAEMIGLHIAAQEKVLVSEAALAEERREAHLREQFTAVLGHDLRNPLASIDACLRTLDRPASEERRQEVLRIARRSVRRMAGLVSDMMDLARGQVGEAMALRRDQGDRLESGLRQVLDEVAASWPDRPVTAHLALAQPVACDVARMAQLCSNLLANAVTHGAVDEPIRLEAVTQEGRFRLQVCNGGPPIPPVARERLFQPYFRGALRPDQQGLGLGLYIAAEIARAHGGTLRVTSDAAATCFTFEMPCAAPGRA